MFVPSNDCQEPLAELLKEMLYQDYDIAITNSSINNSNQLYNEVKKFWIRSKNWIILLINNFVWGLR